MVWSPTSTTPSLSTFCAGRSSITVRWALANPGTLTKLASTFASLSVSSVTGGELHKAFRASDTEREGRDGGGGGGEREDGREKGGPEVKAWQPNQLALRARQQQNRSMWSHPSRLLFKGVCSSQPIRPLQHTITEIPANRLAAASRPTKYFSAVAIRTQSLLCGLSERAGEPELCVVATAVEDAWDDSFDRNNAGYKRKTIQ